MSNRKRVEVKYTAQPMCDGRPALNKRMTALAVTRTVKTMPVTASGAVRHSRAETHESWTFTVPAEEVCDLTREMVSWLGYFAAGSED